jgi:hypothetical protein
MKAMRKSCQFLQDPIAMKHFRGNDSSDTIERRMPPMKRAYLAEDASPVCFLQRGPYPKVFLN